MRDVAALAGVGLTTVSRVLNGETTVAPDLTAKVHRAARALDYRPNVTARNLRSGDGRTRTIGLVLENILNPFSATLHSVVVDMARARGFAVFAGSGSDESDREREIVLELLARRADGLIIVPASDDHSYLANEQSAGTSLVFVDRPAQLLRADAVMSDNISGARDGVRHLLAAGHRRIAFLGGLTRISTTLERLSGYQQALVEAAIDYDDGLTVLDLGSMELAQEAARSLVLKHQPSALFTSQNLVTIGAVRALRDLGLQDTTAILGFDDFSLADLLQPAVSVVAQDPETIAATACDLLFKRMDGDQSAPTTRIVPTRLIARGSGELTPSVG
jgi:LacI family transcriptional regulator